MTALLRPIRLAARIGFIIAAWVLVALVVVQVYHAGHAVLEDPGDWQGHRTLGEMFSLPILPMLVLSVVGWMPIRFVGASLGLFALYALQFVLVYHPADGLPWLRALHPVNALAIFALAFGAARGAWRLVVADWDSGALARRALLAAAMAIFALAAASAGLQAGRWAWESAQGAAADSLADATEEDVPEKYRPLESPFADGDEAAVAAGRQIAQQQCIACHAADFRGRQLGAVRSADLTQSAGTRSEQFLMWAISDGSRRGMPAHGERLSEEQRWQLIAFLKSLKR